MNVQNFSNSKYVVFIPCYNGGKTIIETIQSAIKSINFVNLNIPIFVVDDCSNDDSLFKINSLMNSQSNIYLSKNEFNIGQWNTKNKALNSLKGKYEWVFILHADDVAKENWLFDLIEIISNNGYDSFSVWSSYDVLIDSTKKIEFGEVDGSLFFNQPIVDDYSRIFFANELLKKVSTSWHISGSAINLQKWHELGGFDEQFVHYSDSDIWVRSKLVGMGDLFLAKSLITYRLHGDSVSSETFRKNRDIKEIFLFVHKFFDILYYSNKIYLLNKIIKMCIRRMLKSFLIIDAKALFVLFWFSLKSIWLILILTSQRVKKSFMLNF